MDSWNTAASPAQNKLQFASEHVIKAVMSTAETEHM